MTGHAQHQPEADRDAHGVERVPHLDRGPWFTWYTLSGPGSPGYAQLFRPIASSALTVISDPRLDSPEGSNAGHHQTPVMTSSSGQPSSLSASDGMPSKPISRNRLKILISGEFGNRSSYPSTDDNQTIQFENRISRPFDVVHARSNCPTEVPEREMGSLMSDPYRNPTSREEPLAIFQTPAHALEANSPQGALTNSPENQFPGTPTTGRKAHSWKEPRHTKIDMQRDRHLQTELGKSIKQKQEVKKAEASREFRDY